MSSFFSSLADKAQSALKDTPIAHHIPGASSKPSADGESAFGSRTLDHLSHQLRTFQQQYSSSTTPLQKVITSAKGVAIDFDNLSRDTHAHSKDIYLWGQPEAEDLKDVSDRLGWLNYVQGTLAATLATKLDAARAPYKELRVAETKYAPRRNLRINLENQIKRLETENQRAKEQRVAEVQAQITKLDNESKDEIVELDILKRKAFKESEKLKWEAIREYAEKLVLVTQAATAVLPVVPSIPPTKEQPYTGADTTTNVRAALQKALDTYTPGADRLILPQTTPADLKRSDTRSFGQTHAKELDNIGSTNPVQPSIPLTPPATATSPPSQDPTATTETPKAVPVPVGGPSPSTSTATSPPVGKQSPPLNPATLNQTPASIPSPSDESTKVSPVGPPNLTEPSVLPTVAETGVPKSAGPDGPGPASGSLLNLKSNNKTQKGGDQLPGYDGATGSAPPEKAKEDGEAKWESAEEEKKRLEREERERVLRGESGAAADNQGAPPPSSGDGEDLPAYKEF